ncbi:hypothetical protein WOLCODRAFT_163357 [Wolfiporia cocos MD-104 SS10]|uniref:Uncharacterized protein n=1 Tax=Wolfiporia cocos (strain MD-104) TaxID=742152 RepID=A0A2H3K006_WOLCO|nr:hypothetical protein WOLCODRAFT_163357 [Wolfiporia cocos MD-104 SS10]
MKRRESRARDESMMWRMAIIPGIDLGALIAVANKTLPMAAPRPVRTNGFVHVIPLNLIPWAVYFAAGTPVGDFGTMNWP